MDDEGRKEESPPACRTPYGSLPEDRPGTAGGLEPRTRSSCAGTTSQGADRRFRGLERADRPTLLEVLQTSEDRLLDELLGREHEVAVLEFDFKVVAGLKLKLVVELLRNHDLPARPDLHCGHGGCSFRLYFHIFIF